jgi:MFS transporter, putative metabolite:H+ symporter
MQHKGAIMDKRKIGFALAVSALGYFVDVYDIILFTAVRVSSLKSLLLTDDQITTVGIQLINIQLIGMLIGGLTWGILGDKRGRLSILFGSILLYSTATFANAFVTNIECYALLRFIAGFGLAGELGAGITLVNELMPKEKRGYGTMLIATSGVFGGIAGGLVGNLLSWQMAYMLGGLGGFLLFFLRMGVLESGLFTELKKQKNIKKGSLSLLLLSPKLLIKFMKCLIIGVPIWISIGLLMTLAPELGRALNVMGPITAAWAILFFNVGLGFGDLSSSLLSQLLRSRKKAVLLYLTLSLLTVISFLSLQEITPFLFYSFCALLGFSNGYWAIFMMISAEQFGTNLRATVATSAPNFVRGMVIPFSLILSTLKPTFGIILALEWITLFSIMLAFMAIISLRETFARSLDFVEG